MSGVNYTAAYYGDYVFPPWAEGVGWILAVTPIICVIASIVFSFVKYRDARKATTPRQDWGPRLKENRTGDYYDNLGYDPSNDVEASKAYITDKPLSGNGVFPEKTPNDYPIHKL